MMKKLTELDLQIALDECEKIKFSSHGEWLAGMVKRLNNTLISKQSITNSGTKTTPIIPVVKTTLIIGNSIEPEVPCIS